MKRKLFLVGLVLILVMFLVGCSGGGIVLPSTNITGNWTMTNSSSSGITTAKCNIVDSSGSLTINNFYIVNSEFINWNTGYGTLNGSTISASVSGSYTNINYQTVSTTVYFEGTINSSGIYGTGTWIQTYNAVSYTHLRAHETRHDLVCRLLLEKKK